MHPLPNVMLVAPDRPLFVDGDVQESGTSIELSATQARIGDTILVYSPILAATLAPSGSGWASWTDTYDGKTAGVYWKVIDSLSDITTGVTNHAFGWAVYRNVRSAAKNAFSEGDLEITFGALGAGTVALLIFASIQTNLTPNFGAPAGFSLRLNIDPGASAFTVAVMDTAPDSGAAGLKTLTGYTTPDPLIALTAIELRAQS